MFRLTAIFIHGIHYFCFQVFPYGCFI
jgi:hypothetical protein